MDQDAFIFKEENPSHYKKNIVSSINYSQEDTIINILSLHAPNGIDCDLTYSKGNFYKKSIRQPKYKLDLNPQGNETIPADSRNVPFKNASIATVMFDPPFVAAIPKKEATGIITTRFGYFRNIPLLWKFYGETIKECYRILKNNGVLIFKCQDSVDSSKNYFTHDHIMNFAASIGFYPKDLFILLAKHRLVGSSWKKQQHARKFHCYFWIFIKTKSPINYDLL